MTTQFPAAVDDFSNPLPSTSQLAVRSHSQQHGDLNDAVKALETYALGGATPVAGHGVKASNSAAANTAALQALLSNASVKALLFTEMVPIAGNLTRSNGSLALIGLSEQNCGLRQTTSGGIVFDGGAVTQNYNMPVLNLRNFRLEASVANAGTAVTMTYSGGSGTPPIGPAWNNVVIAPTSETIGLGGPGFNVGVRGTNVRDLHFDNVTIGGGLNSVGHPIAPTMTEGVYFDGASDPVELWFEGCYFYYLQTAIRVGGAYEGVYIDRASTLAIWDFLRWDATGAQPTLHLTNSYIGSERSGAKVDMVSYFRIFGNTFNPTAPVPWVDYVGITVDRTSGDQTQAADIFDNTFVGVGYSSSSAFTETAIWLKNANTVQVHNNTTYDMNVGVLGTAGGGNRCRDNRYVMVDTHETIPAAMRYGNIDPECIIKADRTGSTQSLAINGVRQVIFDHSLRDDRGYYNTGTGLFTLPAGHYTFDAKVKFSDLQVDDFVSLYGCIGGPGGTQVDTDGFPVAKAGINFARITGHFEVNGAQTFGICANIEAASGATRTVSNAAGSYGHTHVTVRMVTG